MRGSGRQRNDRTQGAGGPGGIPHPPWSIPRGTRPRALEGALLQPAASHSRRQTTVMQACEQVGQRLLLPHELLLALAGSDFRGARRPSHLPAARRQDYPWRRGFPSSLGHPPPSLWGFSPVKSFFLSAQTTKAYSLLSTNWLGNHLSPTIPATLE